MMIALLAALAMTPTDDLPTIGGLPAEQATEACQIIAETAVRQGEPVSNELIRHWALIDAQMTQEQYKEFLLYCAGYSFGWADGVVYFERRGE